jgi:hypothetical protein
MVSMMTKKAIPTIFFIVKPLFFSSFQAVISIGTSRQGITVPTWTLGRTGIPVFCPSVIAVLQGGKPRLEATKRCATNL